MDIKVFKPQASLPYGQCHLKKTPQLNPSTKYNTVFPYPFFNRSQPYIIPGITGERSTLKRGKTDLLALMLGTDRKACSVF